MKLEDLGINPTTKRHDKRLTKVEAGFVEILWSDHVGAKNKISARKLATKFGRIYTGRDIVFDGINAIAGWKRDVRHMQNHLLRDHAHIPILSSAGSHGGYWIAGDNAEAAKFYAEFRQRGLTGLVKAARGKQSVLVDIMQQLTFEFADQVDSSGQPYISPDNMPAPVEVVDAFLARMLKNPEKFQTGLKKLSKKYGSVLLPNAQVAEMKARALELQQLVAGLGG